MIDRLHSTSMDGARRGIPGTATVTFGGRPMRTLLTLALLACAATPAAAQMFYPVQGGRDSQPGYYGRSVVRAPRTYVVAPPRVAYSYAPVEYSQPVYRQPIFSYSTYPQTYTTPVQVVSAPRVIYSTPTS